jgi:hypothetical protein
MNRLVEQLLSVGRLDAIALDVSGKVDLNGVAQQAVANLAPWALAQGRTIAFVGADRPVIVGGNAYAIDDAIRNLIENAVVHTPPHTEVTVSVSADGSIDVRDRGPGVPQEDRGRIFERFWRGQDSALARRRAGARHRRGDHESAWRQRRGQRRAAWRRGLHARLFAGTGSRSSIADLQQTADQQWPAEARWHGEIAGPDSELGNIRSRRTHIHANSIVDLYGVPTC